MSREQWKIGLVGIFFYGMVHGVIHNGIKNAETAELWTVGFEILFWMAVFFVLIRKKQHFLWKFALPERIGTEVFLLGIPLVQCLVYGVPKESATAVLHLVAAAVGEEILFRSLVPLYLEERFLLTDRKRMLVSAGVFAAFHLVNLFSAELPYRVLLQAGYAFCVGVGLYALAEKRKSILLGILLHFLINLTAAEDGQIHTEILLTVLFSGIFLAYGMIDTIKKEKQTHETLH